jgi:hypothetical protein
MVVVRGRWSRAISGIDEGDFGGNFVVSDTVTGTFTGTPM